MDTQINWPKLIEVTDKVGACKTDEEVLQYASTLPPEKRWMATCVNPGHYCTYLRNEDGTPKPYNGISGENSITISYSPKDGEAQQEDANIAYKELFRLISSALKEAVGKNKVLHVGIGEAHSNRGSLMLDLMAADIAERLGITNIGIENEEHPVTIETADGRILDRPGLKGWGEHAKAIMQDGCYPENHELALPPDKRVANRAVFIPRLFESPENYIFPTDQYPNSTSTKELLENRDVFQARKIIEHSGDSHMMHFGGSAHLYGLGQTINTLTGDNESQKVHFLGIRTEQDNYITPEQITESDPLRAIRYSAPFIKSILVNGRITTIEQARTLAAGAEKALGETLTTKFFEDNPELAPMLESVQPGGRSREAKSIERSV